MRPDYFLGLDLGQTQDFTALAVLERTTAPDPEAGGLQVHRYAVRHLIYPVPVHAGLGIHLTLDLGGMLRAGPDTEYIVEPRYDIDPRKAQPFADAVRRYFPGVSADDLQPDYAGIRPKLQGLGQPVRDFVIEEASAHGVPGLINLLGIESPGLTASEAIAERVAALLS